MDETFFPDTALYSLGISLPSKGGTGWDLKGISPWKTTWHRLGSQQILNCTKWKAFYLPFGEVLQKPSPTSKITIREA